MCAKKRNSNTVTCPVEKTHLDVGHFIKQKVTKASVQTCWFLTFYCITCSLSLPLGFFFFFKRAIIKYLGIKFAELQRNVKEKS